MKDFLFVPACAILAVSVLASCQREDKSVTTLAKELTAELQTVTDYKTAEAAAPRVKVLYKRLEDAMARTCTLNTNALRRSVGAEGREADELVQALEGLARELGRVQASIPVTSYDGEVDRDLLVLAVGASVPGGGQLDPEATRKEAGLNYLHEERVKDNAEPPPFAECYGSEALQEALAYTVKPSEVSVFRFDSSADLEAVPDKKPVDESADAVDDVEPADDSADDSADTGDVEPAADDADDSSDDAGEDSGDVEPSIDEIPDDSGDSSDDSGSDGLDDLEDISIDI